MQARKEELKWKSIATDVYLQSGSYHLLGTLNNQWYSFKSKLI
jgi:hypothetical protein